VHVCVRVYANVYIRGWRAMGVEIACARVYSL